jgi:uncharacterized protein
MIEQRICPECSLPLESTNIGDVELDFCSSCQGIWFDHNELKSITPKNSQSPPEFSGLLSRPLKSVDNRKRNCPSCQSLMSVKQRHGVELDLCQRCGGIWLDGGELRIVLETLQQEKIRLEKVDLATRKVLDKDLGVKPGSPRPALAHDPSLDPEHIMGPMHRGVSRPTVQAGLLEVGMETLSALFYCILDP